MGGENREKVVKSTSLYDCHVAAGAKMVPFAGYAMPLNYPAGIISEHLHTRANASLFDVSHMGQISIWGDGAAHALRSGGDCRHVEDIGVRIDWLGDGLHLPY